MQQLSMFDTFDPLKEVIKRARPYWKESENRIKDAYNTSKYVAVVKREYCPYGCSGAFGFNQDETNALCGYELRTEYVEATWYDDRGEKQKKRYTWKEFAEGLKD